MIECASKQQLHALIGTCTGKFFDSYDPSTGHVATLVPDSNADDVVAAVEAARAAFPTYVFSHLVLGLVQSSITLCFTRATHTQHQMEHDAQAEAQ